MSLVHTPDANAKPVATRKAFGEALKTLGDSDDKVVVLDADLAKSTQSQIFAKAHPDRFFEMGIQEANMIGTAAGLALSGYTPFCCSFAAFISGRFDQIKMSVAYSQARVRIVGTHAGVGIGPDGYSQQGLEDVALLRSLPGMKVLQPADDIETAQMVEALGTDPEPAYLRLTRQNLKRVHSDDYKFQFGVWPKLVEGNEMAIFASGGTVAYAVEAALKLHADGIPTAVYNASCIKPADEDAVVEAAMNSRGLISVEDHTVMGGMGSVVAEISSAKAPARLLRLGINDAFGESGTPDSLMEKHGLNAAGIEKSARAYYETLKSRG